MGVKGHANVSNFPSSHCDSKLLDASSRRIDTLGRQQRLHPGMETLPLVRDPRCSGHHAQDCVSTAALDPSTTPPGDLQCLSDNSPHPTDDELRVANS